jgi:hypothetical protein
MAAATATTITYDIRPEAPVSGVTRESTIDAVRTLCANLQVALANANRELRK